MGNCQSIKMKKQFAVLIFTAVNLLLFFPLLILAVGVGADPSFLDLMLKRGQPQEVEILVYNISQEAAIYQIFPDQLNDWIKAEPANFRLESGENRVVKIKVLAEKAGKKETNISLLAAPLDRGGFSISSGIKIPVKLIVEKEKSIFLASVSAFFSRNWILMLAVITTAVLVFAFEHRTQFFRRKKNN